MIIKFQDKFESILYAVLYSNLTGYYLSSKNESANLFENEEFIDIDKFDWQEILINHNNKFGQINWLELKDDQYLRFKYDIEYICRFWKDYKYKIIIESLRSALKYGLRYFYESTDQPLKDFNNTIKLIRNEITNVSGEISFLPVNIEEGKFLLGYISLENNIGDLVIKKLANQYNGYQIILKTNRFIYLFYQEELFSLALNKYNLQLDDKSFFRFWRSWQENFIKPVKLKQSLI